MHLQWGYQNLPLKWILNNTFKVDYIFNKTNYLQAKNSVNHEIANGRPEKAGETPYPALGA